MTEDEMIKLMQKNLTDSILDTITGAGSDLEYAEVSGVDEWIELSGALDVGQLANVAAAVAIRYRREMSATA